ncbi:hypothetical protein D3C74_248180 [compost metagenome]
MNAALQVQFRQEALSRTAQILQQAVTLRANHAARRLRLVAEQRLRPLEAHSRRPFGRRDRLETHLLIAPVERTQIGLHQVRIFFLERMSDHFAHGIRVEKIANPEQRPQHRGVHLRMLVDSDAHCVDNSQRPIRELQVTPNLLEITGRVYQHNPVRFQAA